jgi:hypothetical protein
MYEHLKISMNGPCDLDNMSREEIRASLDELVSRMGKTEPAEAPQPPEPKEVTPCESL